MKANVKFSAYVSTSNWVEVTYASLLSNPLTLHRKRFYLFRLEVPVLDTITAGKEGLSQVIATRPRSPDDLKYAVRGMNGEVWKIAYDTPGIEIFIQRVIRNNFFYLIRLDHLPSKPWEEK